MSRFTHKELSVMSPNIRQHLFKMLADKTITEKDDGYYFPSLDDPYNEKPKHKIKVLEYVVWNLAAITYMESANE